MTATVVAVVMFLSGVMVGRGVRLERGELIAAESANVDPTLGLAPSPFASAPASGSSANASPAAGETLSYPDRLGLASDAAPPEALTDPDPTQMPVPAPVARTTRPPAQPPAPAAVAKSSSPAALPASDVSSTSGTKAPGAADGIYAVQVAAIRGRADAERMAKRLVSKGYAAYVAAPSPRTPGVFRVRVGKFKDRHEADAIAAKLRKEEQFKPWVTQ